MGHVVCILAITGATLMSLAGCNPDADADADAPKSQVRPASTATPDANKPNAPHTHTDTDTESHVHKVACGCSLGQKCSNMIEVEGAYMPLKGDNLGLGEMAFCGKAGLEAEVTGKLSEGAFVATSFKLLQAPDTQPTPKAAQGTDETP